MTGDPARRCEAPRPSAAWQPGAAVRAPGQGSGSAAARRAGGPARHRPAAGRWSGKAALLAAAIALPALPGAGLGARVAAPLPGAAAAQTPESLAVAPAPGAMLRGLDKLAGTAHDLSVSVGGSVTFGRLVITLTECRYPVGNPAADGFAHLVIHDTRTPDTAVFRGWMVASSPALNALDHPRFDVWLIRCSSD